MTAARHRTVCLVGGGFTGAAIAVHLFRRALAADVRLLIVEPRPMLGAGLAYGTDDPVHRINVPASRMSLYPDDKEHFLRWLIDNHAMDDDPEAGCPDGRFFPRRSDFGRYVGSAVAPLIADGRVVHYHDKAVSALKTGAGYRIGLESGETLSADLLVIATSHPPPLPPAGLATVLARHPRFIADPCASQALAPIRSTDRVLVVGTGLTMADVIASLDRAGHTGEIVAISRRGQRSRGHGASGVEAYGDFVTQPSTTALSLLRRVRAVVAEAARAGQTWHGVFDALRAQGPGIWAALPVAERQRLLRHLRPFWDTHRFRIAPQIEQVLDRRQAEGSLCIAAASLADVALSDCSGGIGDNSDCITVGLRHRRSGRTEHQVFDAVVVTTGPAREDSLRTEPYLRSLAEQGLVRIDAVGLGIEIDSHGRAIGVDGTPCDTLLVAGPLSRGQVGERMGLPEVCHHAIEIADEIALFVDAVVASA